MDAITVRCKMCKHAMKFSAEKAGKRAKCPKCDTVVLIKAEDEPPAVLEAAPAPDAAAPVAKAADVEDDSKSGYEVFTDPEMEELRRKREAEADAKKKKEKKILPQVTRKVRVIPDAEAWEKVRLGLLVVFFGTCIWGFTHIIQGSYVLLGSVEFSEYAKLIATTLEDRGGVEPDRLPELGWLGGGFWDVDALGIYLGMIAGSNFAGYAYACLLLASVFYFFQAIAWAVGYGICLPVPRRFGTFGQLMVSLGLAVVNFLTMFVFKLLPVVGIISYVLIPFVTPEIVLTEYNQERAVPIHLMWSGAPFWESLLNLILLFILYLQPTFGCIFLWSIGTATRDENLESSAKGLAQMSLGTFFTLLSFHLLSMCGASGVMVVLLRVIYTLWFCFLLLFILQYALLILKCRAVLYDKINPANVLED